MRDRLGDDVHRVRVVEDPRVRADLLHLRADVLQHVDRPQGHEEAAGALSLLADEAVIEGDALVEHPSLEPSWPEGREHGVAVGERCAAIGGGGNGDIEASSPRHLLGEVRISASRSASRSTRTTSEPSKSAPFAIREAIVPAALVEPPPR